MSNCCNNKNLNDIKLVPGKLCYCFNYFEKDFREAIKNNCEQELINEIKSKMKDTGCFCEKSNPSGKCCLADINKFIKKEK